MVVCLYVYRGFISHSMLFSVHRGVWADSWIQTRRYDVNFLWKVMWVTYKCRGRMLRWVGRYYQSRSGRRLEARDLWVRGLQSGYRYTRDRQFYEGRSVTGAWCPWSDWVPFQREVISVLKWLLIQVKIHLYRAEIWSDCYFSCFWIIEL